MTRPRTLPRTRARPLPPACPAPPLALPALQLRLRRSEPASSRDGPLFADLYEHGAELVLTGHSHNYERFAPLTPDGVASPAGVRQFVVGTGGRSLHTNTGPQVAGSEVLRTDVFGVLELALEPSAYSARFVGEDGATVDEASGTCHAPPDA